MNHEISAYCPTCKEYVCPVSRPPRPANEGHCPWCQTDTVPTRHDAVDTDPYTTAERSAVWRAAACAQLALPFGALEGGR